MMGFVLGAVTGYVLGARAGRDRYEQIMRAYHKVSEHPSVQSAAGVAREKVTGAVRGKIRPLSNGKAETGPSSTSKTTTQPRAQQTVGS